MSLDITITATNAINGNTAIIGSFRNDWWLVNYLGISDKDNGKFVELSRGQICQLLKDLAASENEQGPLAGVRDPKGNRSILRWLIISEILPKIDNRKWTISCWW